MTHITRFIRVTMTVAVLSLCVTLGRADAGPVVGAPILVATDGDVIATYLGSTASFTDLLFLDSPAGVFPGLIFNNKTTPIGTMINLGFFTAGTELIFRIHVQNTGNDFFSGSPRRNPDGLAHARVTQDFTPTSTLVEFEDLFNTPEGANGFNDLTYSFTNVRAGRVVTPEPATLASAGLAVVVGLVVARRRRYSA